MRPLFKHQTPSSDLNRLLAASRRAELLHDMLRSMQQAVLPADALDTALQVLTSALGAEGAVVIINETNIAHRAGKGPQQVLDHAIMLLQRGLAADGQEVLAVGERTLLATRLPARIGGTSGLAAWRGSSAPAWNADDRLLFQSGASLIALVVEHRAIEQELARQSRTDYLTRLLNRRAFHEDMERHIDRLEREQLPGTLILADLDGFRQVNDVLGFVIGDRTLERAAQVFRAAVRPADLVARLGADDFALWLNGADQFTAAERAERLRTAVPDALSDLIGPALPPLTLSLGIATRVFGDNATAEDVIQHAEMALQQVKRERRGHWRVARPELA